MGAFPDRWQKLRGKSSSPLLILTSSPKLIPTEFLLEYEKTTGTPVQVKAIESYHLFRTEAQEADLLLAPLGWLGNFPEILKPLPAQNEFHKLLSSDFESMRLELQVFLPVLWTTENREEQTHLLIWGFATPKEDSKSQDFMQFLLTSERRIQFWSIHNELKSTLQLSNSMKSFPSELKAERIREVPLSNLVIDQKN